MSVIPDPEAPEDRALDEHGHLVYPVFFRPVTPNVTPNVDDLREGVFVGWGRLIEESDCEDDLDD